MKKPENHALARSAAVELFHDDDTIPPASQEMFWKRTLNFPGEMRCDEYNNNMYTFSR
jgi:hypothetical protein